MSNDDTAGRVCKHGSLWCAWCKHNIYQFKERDPNASHHPLMGRPKYPPRRPKMKGGKTKKGKQQPFATKTLLTLPETPSVVQGGKRK